MLNDKAMKAMVETFLEVEIPTRPSFRPRFSGLPICPMFVAFAVAYRGCPDNKSYAREVYADVGTTLHRDIQYWLGVGGMIFGDWRCNNRRCSAFSPETDPPQWKRMLGPVKCGACGHHCEYIELEFFVPRFGKKKDPAGHADGFIPLSALGVKDKAKKDHYALLEIKSAATSKITAIKNEPLEQLSWILQDSAYVGAARAEGIEVDAILLWLVDRAFPTRITPLELPVIPDVVETASFEYRLIRQRIRKRQWGRLVRLCDEPKEGVYCPFVDVCFSPVAIDTIDERIRAGTAA
jgi:hypothetical protein